MAGTDRPGRVGLEHDCNLTTCNLTTCNLTTCNLTTCNLTTCNLTTCNLKGAPVELTYVRLLVDNVERAVAFYRDVLGFKVGLEAGDEVYVELKTDGAIVSFYKRTMMNDIVGSPAIGGEAGRNIVLCFNVEDVDTTYREWTEAGAKFITEPHDQEAWYLRVAHLMDTEGNLIEISQALSTAEH